MESHPLNDYVSGSPGFKADIWYNAAGDCIEYVGANEAYVGDRIDGTITIFRSLVDNRPIGFMVKGIQAILDSMDADDIVVKSVETQAPMRLVRVDVLLAVAAGRGISEPGGIRRARQYPEFLRFLPQVGDTSVEVPELAEA